MYSSNIDYFVDLKGLKIPERVYIVKELAYVSAGDSAYPQVLMFNFFYPWKKLTNDYQRENLWLQRCYHDLDWNSGKFEYSYAVSMLHENLDHLSKVRDVQLDGEHLHNKYFCECKSWIFSRVFLYPESKDQCNVRGRKFRENYLFSLVQKST